MVNVVRVETITVKIMAEFKNSWRNFLDEVIATCLLVFVILAMGRDAGFGALSP